MNQLLVQHVRPPLACWFVQQRHNWLGETRELLTDQPDICWNLVATVDQLPGPDLAGSVIVLEHAGQPWPRFVAEVYRIYSHQARVIVTGHGQLNRRRAVLTMAGACAVVSRPGDCRTVARIIAQSCQQQALRPIDWQEDFRRRIPW